MQHNKRHLAVALLAVPINFAVGTEPSSLAMGDFTVDFRVTIGCLFKSGARRGARETHVYVSPDSDGPQIGYLARYRMPPSRRLGSRRRVK